MNSLLIILGISLSVIYCEAAILDYSNITPWKIAYAVYPVYNPDSWVDVWKNERLPEPWVEIWKNERSWDIFDNAINVMFSDQLNSDNSMNREVANAGDSHKNVHSENSEDNHNSKSKQSQTHPWPKNYKDWPKSVKKDH